MKYKTLFRLLLKLLGLCLLAISIYPLAQSVFYLLSALVSVSPSYVWSLKYLFYAVPHVVVGLYLFTGGEWIVNWAIPSNRRPRSARWPART